MAKGIIPGFLETFIDENVQELCKKMPWMEKTDMQLCETLGQLRSFIDRIIAKGIDNKKPLCCLDLETTGLNTRVIKGKPAIKIVGIALAIDANTGIYIPVNHMEGSEFNLPEKEVLEEIKRLCRCAVIIVHNAKYDLTVLKNYGIDATNHDEFEDTLILARLYDAGQKEIGLKHLSKTLLDREMIELGEVTGKSKRFDMVSPKVSFVYAASDSLCTYGLYEFFMANPIVIEQKSVYNLEKKVVPVVIQMEANLIRIDRDYLKAEKIRVAERLKVIEKEIYKACDGREFNIGSPIQLGKMLFEELKYEYPGKEKTKSGQYMTDTATLEKISDKPAVKLIIEYRALGKSLNTYIENLLLNCDEDGFIKVGFNQNGTDTGRFSSPGGQGIDKDGYCGMNVQSIPSNYSEGAPDIRKAFIARPGNKIVALDFSGEELRVTANLSKEKKWIDEFLYGSADLHTTTGKAVFKKDEITKAERQIAKTLNFQILYGSGPRGIAEQAHISEGEARKAVDGFLTGLPILAAWIKSERVRARKAKAARTPFGRVRPLHMFYDSGDRAAEGHADRCSVNFLVQGSCADIMKIAMVRVSNWIQEKNLQDEIKILLTMHDELVFEMPENKLSEYIPALNNIMCLGDVLQGTLKWPVPFSTDAEYGDSWHVDHDFFKEHPELKNIENQITFHQPTQVIEKEVPQAPVEPDGMLTLEMSQEFQAQEINLNKPNENFNNSINSTIIPSEEPLPPAPQAEINNTEEEIFFKIKDRSKVNLMRVNQIIEFLTDECANSRYTGPVKVIKIQDRDGSLLSISNLRVRSDSFYALARFMAI